MPSQKKQILITGGCGYVGSRLVEACLTAGHKVTNIDTEWFGNPLKSHANLQQIKGDIRNISTLKLPKKVDLIFHLANIANDPCGDLDGRLTWEVNALATELLAQYALGAGQPHIIYASSGSVYGIKNEEKVTEELSLEPISDYNKSKMVSERVLLSYQNQLPTTIIRPASVCGLSRRMRLDLAVNMLTMQALTKKVIKILGGDQIRPHIHIEDLVNVYEFFGFSEHKLTGIFNAGFENTSILDLAKNIQAQIPEVTLAIEASNDPRSYRICSQKLINKGYKPKFNINYAISEIIESHQSGALRDIDSHYNLRVMKKLDL